MSVSVASRRSFPNSVPLSKVARVRTVFDYHRNGRHMDICTRPLLLPRRFGGPAISLSNPNQRAGDPGFLKGGFFRCAAGRRFRSRSYERWTSHCRNGEKARSAVWPNVLKPRIRYNNMKTIRRTAGTAVMLIACVAITQTSIAEVVPFKASGTNAEYNSLTGDYSRMGRGTHLGCHSITGQVIPDGVFFPSPDIFLSGTFAGTQTATAGNGDTIEMSICGDVVLPFDPQSGMATGLWFPVFAITGGTGRFVNASGTLEGVVINPPFNPFGPPIWKFDWSIDGEFDYGRRGKKQVFDEKRGGAGLPCRQPGLVSRWLARQYGLNRTRHGWTCQPWHPQVPIHRFSTEPVGLLYGLEIKQRGPVPGTLSAHVTRLVDWMGRPGNIAALTSPGPPRNEIADNCGRIKESTKKGGQAGSADNLDRLHQWLAGQGSLHPTCRGWTQLAGPAVFGNRLPVQLRAGDPGWDRPV